MLANLLGPELFRKGADLYFDRHDGEAVTTDDFVAAMEEVSGRDLTQFKRWYSQAGTPQLEVTDAYDAARQQYRLTITQRSEEHTSELQSRGHLVCRLLLEKKKQTSCLTYTATLSAQATR